MRKSILPLLVVCVGVCGGVARANDTRANQLGQTGLIHMPDGRVAEDGTLRFGFANMDPYLAGYASVTFVPWLEISGRFTKIDDVPAFQNNDEFRDKAFDFKVRLLEESDWLPALAVGRQDFHGTRQFDAVFAAASKQFDLDGIGSFDLTAGWGRDRFSGAFGGVRIKPAWDIPLAFVVEYDGFDYEDDFYGSRTGTTVREGGLGVGVEYTYGWLTGQLSHQDGAIGVNLGLTMPLQQRTFAAKTDEPAPVEVTRPVDPEPWSNEAPATLAPLFEAMQEEGYYGVRTMTQGDTLRLAAGNHRFSTIGRAASRAGRIVALYAPPEITAMEFTFKEYGLPVATYRFADLEAYRGWLAGTVAPPEFQKTLSISYVDHEDWQSLRLDGLERTDAMPADDAGRGQFTRGGVVSGLSLNWHGAQWGSVRVVPFKLRFSYNDPSGVLKYDVHTSFKYYYEFTDEWYFTSDTAITLAETVSDVTIDTTSSLPHVRSDFTHYLRESGRARINYAMFAHRALVADRTVLWVGGGILEQMFSGVGAEMLYLPERGNWAVDLQAFAVKQRNFEGYFGHQDYETVTALAGLHYRIPKSGLTLTARGGRFLARDSGVRFEFKRRFLSGFEVGAWYTITDANDTSPSSLGRDNRDKGIFLRFAAGPFLKRDSAAYADFTLQPWIRDPGAVLNAGGRLHDQYERRLMLNLEDLGPWSDFGQ